MMRPTKPSKDQVLVCPVCGRFAVVDFAVAIAAQSWPRCCEVPMLLALQIDIQTAKYLAAILFTLAEGLERVHPHEKN